MVYAHLKEDRLPVALVGVGRDLDPLDGASLSGPERQRERFTSPGFAVASALISAP